MVDLLIVAAEPKNLVELEELSEQAGVLSKSVTEISMALEWLKMREFDCLLVDSEFSIEDQQMLADLLWSKRPLATFVTCGLNRTKRGSPEVRLFGAEVVWGEKGREQLKKILADLGTNAPVRADKFKIMVVDDLDSPREIICSYLENIGYADTVGLSSATEALRNLNDPLQSFSCIITDMRMPGMTGAELIARVRSDAHLSGLPIIVLTAYGTTDCLIECLKMGASGFLVKPPKRPDLIRELQRAMRIAAHKSNPRLSTPEEAEQMRELLAQKGVY